MTQVLRCRHCTVCVGDLGPGVTFQDSDGAMPRTVQKWLKQGSCQYPVEQEQFGALGHVGAAEETNQGTKLQEPVDGDFTNK